MSAKGAETRKTTGFKMARIGIDARYLENESTGIGRYSFNLLRRLLEIDQKNHYHVFLRPGYSGRFEAPNVTCRTVPYPPISLGSLLALSWEARRCALDLWHAHFPVLPLFHGVPSILTVHDLQPLRVPEMAGARPLPLRVGYRMYYGFAYRWSLARARAVVAVSVSTAFDVKEMFSVPWEKIRVIYEALDESFRPTRAGSGLNGSFPGPLPPRFLLYVGSTLPHKNLGNLLRSFSIVLGQAGMGDLHLVLAGRKSRFEGHWEQEALRLGVMDRVVRTGYVSARDLPILYERASAVLCVSRFEGFGFPALEAMRCGAPVIAACHGSLPEVVGPAAMWVPPDDPERIAEAVLRVLQDQDLRARLKRHGQETVNRFSWLSAARETLRLFETVLGEPL